MHGNNFVWRARTLQAIFYSNKQNKQEKAIELLEKTI
jgi:hypothetical protein